MRTIAEIDAESEALVTLLNDPRYYDPAVQMALARVINGLAWVIDAGPQYAPPVSEILRSCNQTGAR